MSSIATSSNHFQLSFDGSVFSERKNWFLSFSPRINVTGFIYQHSRYINGFLSFFRFELLEFRLLLKSVSISKLGANYQYSDFYFSFAFLNCCPNSIIFPMSLCIKIFFVLVKNNWVGGSKLRCMYSCKQRNQSIFFCF